MKKTTQPPHTSQHSGPLGQVLLPYMRGLLHGGGRKAHRGFTLLLAVLISSVLVALGSALFDIVSKEIRLSSSGRESQFAFYSSDTGIECAFYWDTKQNAFATTSPLTHITCGGSGVPSELTRTSQNLGLPNEVMVTTFSFPIGGVAATLPCSSVTVTKQSVPAGNVQSIQTTVQSRGYNTCDTSNPLRLERAIRARY